MEKTVEQKLLPEPEERKLLTTRPEQKLLAAPSQFVESTIVDKENEVILHSKKYADFDVRSLTHKGGFEEGKYVHEKDMGMDLEAKRMVEEKNGITEATGAVATMEIVKNRLREMSGNIEHEVVKPEPVTESQDGELKEIVSFFKVEDLKELAFLVEILAEKIDLACKNYREDGAEGIDKLYPNSQTILGIEAVLSNVDTELNMAAATEYHKMQATLLLPILKLYWAEESMLDEEKVLTNSEASGGQASMLDDALDVNDGGGFKQEAMKLKDEYPMVMMDDVTR